MCEPIYWTGLDPKILLWADLPTTVPLGVKRPDLFAPENFVMEKVCFTSSNYHESLIFLPQLRNQVLHIPQPFKPCILPPSSDFEDCFDIVTGVATVIIVFYFSKIQLFFKKRKRQKLLLL